jgi:hypothetical protein
MRYDDTTCRQQIFNTAWYAVYIEAVFALMIV